MTVRLTVQYRARLRIRKLVIRKPKERKRRNSITSPLKSPASTEQSNSTLSILGSLSRAKNEEQQEEYCFLESEGTSLELICDLRKTYGEERRFRRPYCPHICFATDDMEKTIKELRARDIEIIRGPLEIAGEETWVYFADPDGNVLEYIHWYK